MNKFKMFCILWIMILLIVKCEGGSGTPSVSATGGGTVIVDDGGDGGNTGDTNGDGVVDEDDGNVTVDDGSPIIVARVENAVIGVNIEYIFSKSTNVTDAARLNEVNLIVDTVMQIQLFPGTVIDTTNTCIVMTSVATGISANPSFTVYEDRLLVFSTQALPVGYHVMSGVIRLETGKIIVITNMIFNKI